MLRFAFLAALALSFSSAAPAPVAAATGPSRCIAFAEAAPGVMPVNFAPAPMQTQIEAASVEITYVTHSTFRVKTPAGVTIATDYAGVFGDGPAPDVATMNHAHETHYTDFPDPAIHHVLRGWNPKGGSPAEHYLALGDVVIRNVTTDIRGYAGTVEPDGNSIFIFEVADLCIGHLGHLHHKPTPAQFARIGRLDIVFAPVDGTMTLDLPTMIEVLKELRASLVIPMHYFDGSALKLFLAGMAGDFAIRVHDEASITVSLPSLPRRPTVLVLPGY